MENLKLGMEFASYDGITPRTTWTGFPDVFSPKFERFCDKRALQLCDPVKKDPWIIGYFIDNELEWNRKTGNGLFADTLAKEKDYPAKIALLDLIRKRHATIDSFNRAWKTGFRSFDDLESPVTVPNKIGTPEAQGDEDEYLALVAEKYFSIATRAIRKYDPNHLILGCRFAGRAPARVWAAAGKYCDVVSVNCYRTLDLATGVPSDRFDSEIDQWFTSAKRPMMVTEWAFPALDSGLPCTHGAGQRVPTQKDRSFLSGSFQKLLFSKNYVVGSDMFKWVDQPALGVSATFPEDSNYGLVDVNDSPYEELVNMFTQVNAVMYELHGKSVESSKP